MLRRARRRAVLAAEANARAEAAVLAGIEAATRLREYRQAAQAEFDARGLPRIGRLVLHDDA